MENNIRSPLHPILTVAAIAVTVFSAVGVATLTGMIPQSRGTTVQAAPTELLQPSPAAAVAPAPVVAAPKPRPVMKKKPAVRTSDSWHDPHRQEPIATELAQAPQTIEAAKPLVQPGVLGMVESVREVKQPGEAKGLGVVAGGVAGAMLGHQVGSGRGNTIATLLGAVGGAVAGNHVEKQARAEKRWDVTVRLDDGTTQTLSSPSEPAWHAGDRVRLHEGKLEPV